MIFFKCKRAKRFSQIGLDDFLFLRKVLNAQISPFNFNAFMSVLEQGYICTF